MMILENLARALATAETSSRELLEQCLSRIDASEGEGARAMLKVYRDSALEQAEAVDAARRKGWSLPRYSGIPLSIKDLFDCAGEVTTAGSHVLDEHPAASADAAIVQALRRAGFIIVGKANMTEFAYSGLGINAHYGTPRGPYERDSSDILGGRIPGGSSCGGAVSVCDAMAAATIGTDTGGSCRIPAAFCGVVGFKPTADRVSRQGCVPLSSSLDSIGPLANSVSCCSILDAVISGSSDEQQLQPFPVEGLRIGVLEGYPLELMDETVAASFAATLSRLSEAGAQISRLSIDELNELPAINHKGGLVGAESYAWHKPLLDSRAGHYDPWVRARLEFSASQSAADYIELLNQRKRFKALVLQRSGHLDVLALPSVQIVPPLLSSLHESAHSNKVNQICLRNTAIANFIDHPAISIPNHERETIPTGFMLMACSGGDDRRLLSIAAGFEPHIRPN